MRKLVFVYGEDHKGQITKNEIKGSEEAEFESYVDGSGQLTLHECWGHIANIMDEDELYEGVSILPHDILQNTHLLNEIMYTTGRWVIIDRIGYFDVGRLKKVGHFYSADVGGVWSGWLPTRDYGIHDENDIVSVSKMSPKEARERHMGTQGGVWNGVGFNSTTIGAVDLEQVFIDQELKIGYLKGLMSRDPGIERTIGEMITGREDPLNLHSLYINALGGIVPKCWYVNWEFVKLEEQDITRVSDAYILDGVWVSQESTGLNWLDWVQHCNETWDMQDSETRITVYSVD